MNKEQYQEFIEFTQNLYADRDAFSRGKIIEDMRDKVTELQQSSIVGVVQAKPEVCEHCKIPFKYDEKLDWDVCPECGNEKRA